MKNKVEQKNFFESFFLSLEKRFVSKKKEDQFDDYKVKKQYRILALYIFLIIAGAFFTVFAFISFFLLNEFWAGVYQTSTIFLFALYLWVLQRKQNYCQIALYANLTLAIGTFVYISLVHEKYFSFIWTTFVPFFFIFLLGNKRAIKFVFTFDFAISLVALYGVFYWQGNWDFISFFHYIMFLYGSTFFYLLAEYFISKQEHRLIWLSETDPLTSMYNRRKIESILRFHYQKIKMKQKPISVAILDIDDFKKINDRLGHSIGDQVLTELAGILKNNLPSNCYVGRWGGEEFLFVFPNKTPQEAKKIIQTINQLVKKHKFYLVKNVECSVGVCGTTDPPNLEKMIIATDRALYTAKEQGKNRIVISRCKSYRLKDD